mmetsp:Transcript_118266/g.331241  ORF Transcript_118266/g.331241 Transcript_118266/m.331241 type:complete len:82 (+) Transcript_118266:722-967(+)
MAVPSEEGRGVAAVQGAFHCKTWLDEAARDSPMHHTYPEEDQGIPMLADEQMNFQDPQHQGCVDLQNIDLGTSVADFQQKA